MPRSIHYMNSSLSQRDVYFLSYTKQKREVILDSRFFSYQPRNNYSLMNNSILNDLFYYHQELVLTVNHLILSSDISFEMIRHKKLLFLAFYKDPVIICSWIDRKWLSSICAIHGFTLSLLVFVFKEIWKNMVNIELGLHE